VIWKELLGFVAGALMNVGFIPQVWRLFKLKSAREISLPFTLLFLAGLACWLAYGILLNLPPVILWNAIATAMMCAMLYAKLKYGR
jgi:MtN3 and saliva related transmembrane protein